MFSFSIGREPSAVRRLLAGAVLLTLLLHAAVALWRGDHFLLGSYEQRNNDDVKYVYAAQMLLEKGTLVYNSGGRPTDYIMPSIPLMLSGLMALLERDEAVMAFRLLQCFMQAASVYLIYIIARHMFGVRTALASAWLSLLYVPDLFASGAVLTESTFKLLFLLLLCAVLRALSRRTASAYALVGILLGLCCYVKPQSVLFPLCLMVIWLVRRYSWKEIAVFTAMLGLCSTLLLSPWWIRNYKQFDRFIPFTRSTGNPMLLGALIKREAPPEGFFEQYPQYKNGRLFAGSDSWEGEAARRLIAYQFKHRPLAYAYWFTIGKTIRLFDQPFYSRPVPGLPRSAINVLHLLYVIAGFAGIAAAIRDKGWRPLLPLLLPFGYFWLIHLPFVTFARYGYGLMSLLTIFAAAGVMTGIGRWRDRGQTGRVGEASAPS